MECPKCQFKVPGDSNFCNKCGKSLQEPEQATPIDFTQPHSYTPKLLAEKILTTRSAMAGERKRVTVRFADIAGFTSMSEILDPDQIHQIMDGCFNILIDEIREYKGTTRLPEPNSKYKKINSITTEEYLKKARTMFEEMDLQWDLDELEKVMANR
jgi:class 3 adenylate cyclase